MFSSSALASGHILFILYLNCMVITKIEHIKCLGVSQEK